MKVTIDASSMLPPRTGVGNYTYHLVQNLLRLDKETEYRLLLNSLRRPAQIPPECFDRPNASIRRRRVPGPWLHRAWRRLGWPPIDALVGTSGDIVHAPAAVLPPLRQGALVVTLHDLYFMEHPEHSHPLGGLYLRSTLPRRIRQCEAVLCVSEFTKREALKMLDLGGGRVFVTPCGVDTATFRVIDDSRALAASRERFGLPENFLVTVATLEPRKNLVGLCHVMERLLDIDIPLVCVGGQGFDMKPLWRTIGAAGLQDRVLFLGHVPPEDLPAIYNLASVAVVPSLYEGFGLPVLEAMACGTPVVAASEAESLAEVGGAAATYAPVSRPDEMASAIRDLLTSRDRHAAAVSAGLKRAVEFSWEETARKTLAVYREVAGRGVTQDGR